MDSSHEFLKKLANLCEQYKISIYYTTDDDGIHIDMGGKPIFVGYLDENCAQKLNDASNKTI